MQGEPSSRSPAFELGQRSINSSDTDTDEEEPSQTEFDFEPSSQAETSTAPTSLTRTWFVSPESSPEPAFPAARVTDDESVSRRVSRPPDDEVVLPAASIAGEGPFAPPSSLGDDAGVASKRTREDITQEPVEEAEPMGPLSKEQRTIGEQLESSDTESESEGELADIPEDPMPLLANAPREDSDTESDVDSDVQSSSSAPSSDIDSDVQSGSE